MTLVYNNTIGANTDTLVTKTYTIAYILIFKIKYKINFILYDSHLKLVMRVNNTIGYNLFVAFIKKIIYLLHSFFFVEKSRNIQISHVESRAVLCC